MRTHDYERSRSSRGSCSSDTAVNGSRDDSRSTSVFSTKESALIRVIRGNFFTLWMLDYRLGEARLNPDSAARSECGKPLSKRLKETVGYADFMSRLIHEELSRDIIAAAMKVHAALKPGLDEKLYENALVIELAKRGHQAEQQKSFSVHYEGHFIGKMTPDLIVDDLIVADPKVVDEFNKDHFSRMLGYLAITGLELALLLNFKHASLEWKRIAKSGREATEVPEL